MIKRDSNNPNEIINYGLLLFDKLFFFFFLDKGFFLIYILSVPSFCEKFFFINNCVSLSA